MTELEIQQAIDQAVLTRPDMMGSQRVELRMSAAGDCPRLLDYKLQNGRPEASLQSAMRLLTGEPIHDFYRGVFSSAFSDFTMAESELALDLGLGDPVLGHCDGFIPSIGAVLEVKTVSESTFKMVKGSGEPLMSHRAQGNLYCGCIEGASQVLFLYHNRNSGEYLVYLVPFSATLFVETKAKFLAAREREAAGVMHDRPYQDPTESPCFFCDFKSQCYEGFDSQVASGNSQLAEGETALLSDGFITIRRNRLAMEKSEDHIKGRLMTTMIENKISRLIYNNSTLEVRVGKTGKPLLTVKEQS